MLKQKSFDLFSQIFFSYCYPLQLSHLPGFWISHCCLLRVRRKTVKRCHNKKKSSNSNTSQNTTGVSSLAMRIQISSSIKTYRSDERSKPYRFCNIFLIFMWASTLSRWQKKRFVIRTLNGTKTTIIWSLWEKVLPYRQLAVIKNISQKQRYCTNQIKLTAQYVAASLSDRRQPWRAVVVFLDGKQTR